MMKKFNTLKCVFSPDCFKTVFLVVSVLGVCPLLSAEITPFLKLFHIYAVIVLSVDLFTEQRILRNKGRFLLVLFAISYVGTLLNNTNLINLSGLSNAAYLFATLGLVFSYGKDSTKADWIGGNIVCILISAANLIGICMFFTKYCEYYPGRGYIGMFTYENRLCGIFGNPNVLGMVSLSGIYFSSILFATSEKRKYKCVYIAAGIINLIALLLSNSRTQIYSLIFSCAVFTFMQVVKGRKGIKGASLAVLAAALVTAVVSGGVRLTQTAFSAIDINYDYYLDNVILEKKNDVSILQAEQDAFVRTILRDDSGLNGRRELWLKSIPLIKSKPLFGIGLDNHDYAFAALGMEGILIKGNLHNVYLEIIACCGFVGFACFVAFLLIMLFDTIKFFKHNDGKSWTLGALLLATIAGFLLDGVADSTLVASVYPTALAFWFISSQFACLMEQENQKTNHYNPELLGKLANEFFKKGSRRNR